MSTALQVHQGDGAVAQAAPAFSREQISLIKATVAKGATDSELQLFLHLAGTYGLDPFAKEIWCIKYGNSPATIFTSRDGYLKIANNHPQFSGIMSDVVRESDDFQISQGSVEHSYNFPRGPIVGAYALVFRRDRQFPVYVFAPFEEYNAAQQNPTWKKYPSAMIQKVAEAMALKRSFSISGLVTKEELDASEPAQLVQAEVVQEPGASEGARAKKGAQKQPPQPTRLGTALSALGLGGEDVELIRQMAGLILTKGVDSLRGLSDYENKVLALGLEMIAEKLDPDEYRPFCEWAVSMKTPLDSEGMIDQEIAAFEAHGSGPKHGKASMKEIGDMFDTSKPHAGPVGVDAAVAAQLEEED